MTRRIIFIFLSLSTLALGLRYWWINGLWWGLIHGGSVATISLSVLVLFAIILISYAIFRYSIPSKKLVEKEQGSRAKSLVMYIFASLATLVNFYLAYASIASQGSYHDFPNWFYPIIPNLFFSVLFLLPLTFIVWKDKKTVRNSWLMLLLSLILAEIVGNIFQ